MKTAEEFVINDLEASMTFDGDVELIAARDAEWRAQVEQAREEGREAERALSALMCAVARREGKIAGLREALGLVRFWYHPGNAVHEIEALIAKAEEAL